MVPLRKLMVIALLSLLVAGAGLYVFGWPGGKITSGDPRYDEIAELIEDNLHWGRHFTYAVTAETIADTRAHVTAADIPVLVRMPGDERGTVVAATSGLLATFGETARPALETAAESSDWRAALAARDALSTIDRCRENPAGTNPDVCP